MKVKDRLWNFLYMFSNKVVVRLPGLRPVVLTPDPLVGVRGLTENQMREDLR